MSATFCIVHCTKRPLNEPVLAMTHVPSPQNANLVMGAKTSYMRLTGSCVKPFNCRGVPEVSRHKLGNYLSAAVILY